MEVRRLGQGNLLSVLFLLCNTSTLFSFPFLTRGNNMDLGLTIIFYHDYCFQNIGNIQDICYVKKLYKTALLKVPRG